jgi:hypothetical protein
VITKVRDIISRLPLGGDFEVLNEIEPELSPWLNEKAASKRADTLTAGAALPGPQMSVPLELTAAQKVSAFPPRERSEQTQSREERTRFRHGHKFVSGEGRPEGPHGCTTTIIIDP